MSDTTLKLVEWAREPIGYLFDIELRRFDMIISFWGIVAIAWLSYSFGWPGTAAGFLIYILAMAASLVFL